MTTRGNQPTTGRDFFFSPSGDNDLVGTSDENPVADPNQAISNAIALSPPPGTSNPASINASVSGTYSSGVVVPQFVTCRSESASILTADAINVQVMGRHTVEWGSLLNFSNNGICVKMDGVTRAAVEVNACAPIGEDGIGFSVSGLCDEVFVELRLGDIQGERGIMFDHTANSPTPIQYNVENIEFNSDDQTVIRYNDPVGTTATVFNVSDAQTRNGGAVAPGSIVAHIIAGIVVADSDVLSAETIAKVENGGILTLSAQDIFGNTLIESGGAAIYPSMALCIGDLETQAGASLQTRITNIIGNATNAGSMSIMTDSFQGEIVNTGDMFVVIGEYTGTLPANDGSIDGIINGEYYGSWRQKPFQNELLFAFSMSDQLPTGLDAPLQIEFGVAQGSVTDPIELKSNGSILIHKADQYKFVFLVQYGRVGAGGSSWMFFRILVDNEQIDNSVFTKIDGSGDDIPLQLIRTLNLTAGQTVTIEIVRDSQGNDSGGLFFETPTLGDWAISSSASLRVSTQTLIQSINLIAVLPGSSGDYFSTPDSVAASITGDLDIQMRVSPTDWTPSTTETLMSKWEDTGFEKSYLVQLSSTGALRLFLSEDGAVTLGPATSSVPVGFVNETLHWVRVTWDQATGDVDFYTSEDNTDNPTEVSWTALGVTQTLSPSAIFDSVSGVEVGSHNTGTINFDGSVSRASIFNGATLAVDFNPQDYRAGSTFASSLTGEVWTLNGNVEIEP